MSGRIRGHDFGNNGENGDFGNNGEGGEEFYDDECDDARGWSDTGEGGEDFYNNDADFGDARW